LLQVLERGSNDKGLPERAGQSLGNDAVILVVDGDAAERAKFALVLSGMGSRVIEVSTGLEALGLAAEHDVALVVLDNRLPDESGLEVLAALRAEPATAQVPVIFVADFSDVVERAQALAAGAHECLTKPVDLYEMRERARNHLSRRHDWVGEEGRPKLVAPAATRLSRARMDGSVELVAAAACRELGLLHDTVDVALHAFTGGGLTECLGEHRRDGGTTPGGRPLANDSARLAYQRAPGGPWVESTHACLIHVWGAAPLLPGPRTVAWVPLCDRHQVLGVIMISAAGDDRGDDVTRRVTAAMSTAATLAPTITSLLGPGIETLVPSEDRRARLQRVMNATSVPVFQPIRDLGDHTVEGYEALTRFADGTPPNLRLAEAASLGGLVALEAALCRASLAAVAHLPEASWVSVNASPSLLLDTATLHDVVHDHHGPPLVLEITEHYRIEDFSAVRRAVDELGVEIRLSMDDVGDGSCLRHMLDLRPSFIKIDTSWVHGIESDPTRQALVRGLAQFSSRNGCRLIAEGIETERQLEPLLRLGVGLGQGFHLGRPSRAVGPHARAGAT